VTFCVLESGGRADDCLAGHGLFSFVRSDARSAARALEDAAARPRHTHATLLLKAGVPIKVVSERLGHSTPAFTMATYQHILPGMQREAAETFASLLELLPDSTR
jgi:integrase